MMTETTAPASAAASGDTQGPHDAPMMPVHHPNRRRLCRRPRPAVARTIYSLLFVQLVSSFLCSFFAVRTELPSPFSPSIADAFTYSHRRRRQSSATPAFSLAAVTRAKTVSSFVSQSSVVPVARTTRDARPRGAKLSDDDEEEEVRTLEFTLTKHKPLGCTVEESLATSSDECSDRGPNGVSSAGEKPPVFVTKLVEGGNAAEAGIEVGDVLIGLSGVFGDIQDVSGVGIEKIRALVAGKRPDEPLAIRVLRGTDVMERHEDALVDLCTLPGGTDDTLDACVDAIMSSDVIVDEEGSEPAEPKCGEDDAECLVDDLYKMWGEDMPPPPPLVDGEGGPVNGDGANGDAARENGEGGSSKKKEVAPWSSRSSPSGTYARNPATGKLERID